MSLIRVVLTVFFRFLIHIIGLRGLPDEWRAALEKDGISEDECINNSDAVINCLYYQYNIPEIVPTAKDMLDINNMLNDSTLHSIFSLESFTHSRMSGSR